MQLKPTNKMDDDFQAHRADQDAEATYRVLMGQLDKYAPDQVEDPAMALPNDMDVLAEESRMNNNVDFAGRIVWHDMVDKDGNMPKMKEALLADSIGTIAGSVTGTSTVTTFVESASGVEAGGRTGLTSLTTAILFLASMFLAPIAAIIPAAATSSALIYVGILMLSGLKKINFDDLTQGIPVALMMISIPISGSIGHGIGIGMISYSVICLFTGKAKQVSILTYAISLLFLVKFFLVA